MRVTKVQRAVGFFRARLTSGISSTTRVQDLNVGVNRRIGGSTFRGYRHRRHRGFLQALLGKNGKRARRNLFMVQHAIQLLSLSTAWKFAGGFFYPRCRFSRRGSGRTSLSARHGDEGRNRRRRIRRNGRHRRRSFVDAKTLTQIRRPTSLHRYGRSGRKVGGSATPRRHERRRGGGAGGRRGGGGCGDPGILEIFFLQVHHRQRVGNR